MLDGNITPETFESKRFNDQDIKDMIGMLTLELPDEFADEKLEVLNARLTATLKNGEQLWPNSAGCRKRKHVKHRVKRLKQISHVAEAIFIGRCSKQIVRTGVGFGKLKIR